MTLLSHNTLQAVADGLQTTKLGEEAARALAPHVEVRVREIVQEALKFARHSKRSLLTADDITCALKLRNVEPVYGAGGKDPGRFLGVGGHSNLFFVPDPVLSLQEVIEAPLPKPPTEIAVLQHWLAIDGVQPAIPENTPLQRSAKRQRLNPPAATVQASFRGPAANAAGPAPEVAAAHAASTDATADHPAAAPVRAPVKHQISQELQVYFDRVAALLRAGPGPTPAAGSDAQASGGGAAEADTQQGKQKKQKLQAVLASLASDAGLHPVAPYFSQLLAEEVAGSLKDVAKLHLLLEAMSSLLRNPHLSMEPYIQQLMPAIMTCIVRKQLGGAGWESQNHWRLREHAARVAAQVCEQFPSEVYGIQKRITKTFVKTLCDPSKPLVTQYGAIAGLAALGSRVVCLLLMPNLQPFLSLLEPHLPPQLRQDPIAPQPTKQPSAPPSAAPIAGSNGSQNATSQSTPSGNAPCSNGTHGSAREGAAAAGMHPWDASGDEPKGLTGQARQRRADALQCRAALLRALGPCLHSIACTGLQVRPLSKPHEGPLKQPRMALGQHQLRANTQKPGAELASIKPMDTDLQLVTVQTCAADDVILPQAKGTQSRLQRRNVGGSNQTEIFPTQNESKEEQGELKSSNTEETSVRLGNLIVLQPGYRRGLPLDSTWQYKPPDRPEDNRWLNRPFSPAGIYARVKSLCEAAHLHALVRLIC
ncbi:hypothetical protein WJX74_004035 [Apatococcus lobatus]|uniref:TATA box binding protein associated factor (TAF) histone-like fold domain-containing protein n=1 Tax=Apatococcus lobatus TaxID=904363 RepID=A0AAW1SFW6_9CHLO